VTTRRGPLLPAVWSHAALPPLAFIALFIAWQWSATALQIRPWILPAPSAIVSMAYDWRVELLRHTVVTTTETVCGFLLAAVLAVPLSIAVVWSVLLRRTLYPILLALQSIPKVALAPLITLWVGFGLWPKIVVVFLVCFFPVVVNTIAGLEAAPAPMIDLMRSMCASSWQIFRRVRVPIAIPHFLVGCKIAVTFAVIGAVIAEFVGSEEGLGYLILTASAQSQTALAFAALTVLTILSVALYYLTEMLERSVVSRMAMV
jgi:NitT/TauT family transport system permease protein